ncbi:TMEM175 family protein [Halosquirtibacter xylanolyticus]|uniref:TMEM175 family protein n=1 Tax=Halosquirtibacter xylanolyticus TaxID=3374599 RepID=UPI0037479533|nr:TMEM175 family protein [Prolixibacteraceae bacterium]
METSRLEAFSDAVIAIIITIMVLEMEVPHSSSLEALKPLVPTFITFVISFVFLGIYWNNHHHLMHAVKRVNGKILWANLHLLFWLSLFPFVTGWVGQNLFSMFPTLLYGIVLLMAAFAYHLLVITIIKSEGKRSFVSRYIGRDFKGKVTVGINIVAIISTFLSPIISMVLYLCMSLIWIIPDRRIEKNLKR